MSKILIITNHSYMFYRFRLELIQELMKEHEVVLSMPFVGHEEDFQALGIRCINTVMDRRGTRIKSELDLFCSYYRMIKDEHPDLVVTYSIKPNIYAGMVCRMLGIRYCVNVQGLGTAFQEERMARFVTVLYKVALRKAGTVFFENRGNAQEFLKRRIIPEKKQVVLAGAGINLDRYMLSPYPDNDITHFLYLGRIMREKGVDELFEAAERLHTEDKSFVIDLVGFFEDEYGERVKELESRGIVKFHGFQQEPRPFYADADCVVLPSYHEGMSNVLLEAASMGRPIITSRIYGCMEAVVEGESGYLCTVKDADSLYDAMKTFLALPREEREAMGKRSREHAEKTFEKGKVVTETIQVLNLQG